MDNSAIKSMNTGRYATRLKTLAAAACAGILMLSAGSAQSEDQKSPREKMVELNRQALFFYEAKEWEDAKDVLSEALDIAEESDLEENNMTARTYLHLGAVYWVGFHDRDEALQNFAMAKKIRPDIRLTPLIETADLQAVFDSASDTVKAASPFVPTPPKSRPAKTIPTASANVAADNGESEPDLPASMSAPLMCTIPMVASPNKALTIRCALKPGLNATVVQIHYRPRGTAEYEVQRMQQTARGWYIVTLPRDLMQKGRLHVYFDARDDTDNQVASIGQFSSPTVIAIRERSPSGGGGPHDDPLKYIREQERSRKYEAGLHRRRSGSFWLGMGAGAGWGSVPAGNLEWERNVHVSALSTTTGLFHLMPEVGYMLSDNFGLALQGRIEFIRQQQAVYTDPNTGESVQLAASLPNSPATKAVAVFARAIGYLDLSRSGNLRFAYSGDIGAGYIRLPVAPNASVSYRVEDDQTVVDYDRTIAKTDTRPVGTLLVGPSLGIIWNASRHFAIALNGRALGGLPSWGVVFESTLSMQLAFGGKRSQDSLPEDTED